MVSERQLNINTLGKYTGLKLILGIPPYSRDIKGLVCGCYTHDVHPNTIYTGGGQCLLSHNS